VAFIWTIFPSPLTDRMWLRRDLSASLYLLANFFSVVNSSLKANLHQNGGDEDVEGTPSYRLKELRTKLFGKLMLLLPSLEQHARFQKWEPTIGGRFPRETYEEIIMRSIRYASFPAQASPLKSTSRPYTHHEYSLITFYNRISRYLALTAHTITWPPKLTPSDTLWLSTLSSVLADVSPMQHTVISTLTLLSNSMLSGQSLPPFVHLPRPYELSRQLEALGGEAQGLLSARNMEQHGFSEFAVLQVCATLISDDLEGLYAAVSQLVGVVDFSFAVEIGSQSTLQNDGNESTGSGSGVMGGEALRSGLEATGAIGVRMGEKGKGKAD
jgi:hypothetical protein